MKIHCSPRETSNVIYHQTAVTYSFSLKQESIHFTFIPIIICNFSDARNSLCQSFMIYERLSGILESVTINKRFVTRDPIDIFIVVTTSVNIYIALYNMICKYTISDGIPISVTSKSRE